MYSTRFVHVLWQICYDKHTWYARFEQNLLFIENLAKFKHMFIFQYSELETILGDVERARAIFELAVGQTLLDMPEVWLYKLYILFKRSKYCFTFVFGTC